MKSKTKAVLCKELKRKGSGEVLAALTVKPHQIPADPHRIEVGTTKRWLTICTGYVSGGIYKKFCQFLWIISFTIMEFYFLFILNQASREPSS